MGYYENNRYDRRGGGYGRGWNGDGGYGRDFDRNNSHGRFRFEIGEKVLHVASGIELSVISYGREQLECRKPDLTTGWFYEHELEPISNNNSNSPAQR